MPDRTFTFRVENDLKVAFAAAAKAADRSGAQLLRDFMRAYVTQQQEDPGYDGWLRQQVQIGIDAANTGRVVSDADVEAEFAARRMVTLRQLGSDKAS